MFTITAEPTFEHSVFVPHYRYGTINFTFIYVPPSEIAERRREFEGKAFYEVIPLIVLDWDVRDDGGQPVQCSPDAIGVLLDALYCGQLIYDEWLKGLTGARLKN